MNEQKWCQQCHTYFTGASYEEMFFRTICQSCHHLLQTGQIQRRKTTVGITNIIVLFGQIFIILWILISIGKC